MKMLVFGGLYWSPPWRGTTISLLHMGTARNGALNLVSFLSRARNGLRGLGFFCSSFFRLASVSESNQFAGVVYLGFRVQGLGFRV